MLGTPQLLDATSWSDLQFYLISEECLFEDIKNYHYLTYGNVDVPGMNDHDLYKQLLEAFDIMNFTKDEQLCKFGHFLAQ